MYGVSLAWTAGLDQIRLEEVEGRLRRPDRRLDDLLGLGRLDRLVGRLFVAEPSKTRAAFDPKWRWKQSGAIRQSVDGERLRHAW